MLIQSGSGKTYAVYALKDEWNVAVSVMLRDFKGNLGLHLKLRIVAKDGKHPVKAFPTYASTFPEHGDASMRKEMFVVMPFRFIALFDKKDIAAEATDWIAKAVKADLGTFKTDLTNAPEHSDFRKDLQDYLQSHIDQFTAYTPLTPGIYTKASMGDVLAGKPAKQIGEGGAEEPTHLSVVAETKAVDNAAEDGQSSVLGKVKVFGSAPAPEDCQD